MSKLRVCWNPQVDIVDEPFYIPVSSLKEAKKVMDMMAAYDAFQRQNKVKADYCNCGSLEQYNEETKEWEEWYLDTEDDFFDDLDAYFEQLDDETIKEELEEFSNELFKQIDWEKIEKMS